MRQSCLRGFKALVILLSALFAIGGYGYYFFNTPLHNQSEPFTYVFSSKSSIQVLLKALEEEGMLQSLSSNIIYYYLRISRQDKTLQAGEYALNKNMTPRQLIHKLQKGDVVQHAVTLIEGQTLQASLDKMKKENRIRKIWLNKNEKDLIAFLQCPYPSLEGLIFPDTYYFTLNTTDKTIITSAYALMQERLQKVWNERATDCVLKSPYEVLILASIIEKETAVASEREKVSGVFQRRLKKNMRLDADPTVVYGLQKQVEYECDFQDSIVHTGGSFLSAQAFFTPSLREVVCAQLKEKYENSILKKEDLKFNTPYNTYRVTGLPPTPIALPSLSSMIAACHPDKSENLYFVAKGDGSHYFSKTLVEHNLAVDKYIKGISNEQPG